MANVTTYEYPNHISKEEFKTRYRTVGGKVKIGDIVMSSGGQIHLYKLSSHTNVDTVNANLNYWTKVVKRLCKEDIKL